MKVRKAVKWSEPKRQDCWSVGFARSSNAFVRACKSTLQKRRLRAGRSGMMERSPWAGCPAEARGSRETGALLAITVRVVCVASRTKGSFFCWASLGGMLPT
jgi:hypothetical protein